ncbi:MAG: helix-turn-helix transcriptional regulator [Schlesneria sp.]
MILDDRFRTKVRAAMLAHGWSQAELARRMNVDRQYVFKYLGQNVSPETKTIEKFAEALNVDPGNLTDRHELEILSPAELTT